VLFFSLSSNKEDLYILPIYPAAAAIVGGLLARFVSAPADWPVVRWTVVALGAALAVSGAATVYLFGGRGDELVAGATAIGGVALAGGFLALIAILLKRRSAALALTALAVIVLNWVFVLVTLPDFERFKPARAFSDMIGATASEGASAGYYRFASPSMVFYLRRPIFEHYSAEALAAEFSSGKEVYCLMTRSDYESIKDGLPPPTYVLASRPFFQVKLKGIIDRAELPQVVLISNRGGLESAR